MPSRIKKNGIYRYRASVVDPARPGMRIQKLFPDDSKASFRAAVIWEEETASALIRELETSTVSLVAFDWATAYMDYASGFSKKTYNEKRSVFRRLFAMDGVAPEMPVEQIDTPLAYTFLKAQADSRSGYAANKDRKNLAVAWSWGVTYVRGFPGGLANPFQAVRPFSEERSPRYVPPVDDFWRIYDAADGQDKVMLLTFLHLAARRGELFGLKVSDLDLPNNQVRLWTKKRKDGTREYDWLPLTSDLKSDLIGWLEERMSKPAIDTDHVFVCVDETPFCDSYYGKPFEKRQHLMKRLCRRAGVKPFDMHAIRHLTATVLYHKGYTVSFIQRILRHKAATTTQRYLQRLGLGKEVREQLEAGLERPAMVIPFEKKKASGA